MKKIFLLCLSIAIFSCETSTKEKKSAPIIEKETPKEVIVPKKEKKVDPTLVKLKKKACSGDCPVFEVLITKDSILTYKGIRYTHVRGTRIVKLSPRQFTKLSQILEKSNFLKLKRRYTKSGTKDFAETVITYQDKKVTVRLWKDSPDRLTDIYVFIEDILYNKRFLK